MALRNLLFKNESWLKGKKFLIFQEHTAQRGQSRKPKGCGNEKQGVN